MDKIKLKTTNFNLEEILENENLELEIKYIDKAPNSRKELISSHLQSITKAYLNTELFNIDVKRFRNTLNWYFSISFNPNKIHQSNINSLNPIDNISNTELFNIFTQIQNGLYELGFNLDISEMSLNRYDVCLDVSTELEVKAYFPMNIKLRPNGKYKQQQSKYEGSIYHRSKTSEICIYDKSKELLDKRNSNYEGDASILRYEFRYFKKLKDIKLKDIDFLELKSLSYKRLINLFEVDIMKDDIENEILSKLNDNLETFNKTISQLKTQILYVTMKELMNNNEVDNLRDLIYKDDLTKTEKESISRIGSEIKKTMIINPYLQNLFIEIKSKLQTKSKLYSLANEEYKTYSHYLLNK